MKLNNICKLQCNLTKLFVIWRKLQRAHRTKSGHFAPDYSGGIDKLRASLEFLYDQHLQISKGQVFLFTSERKRGVLKRDRKRGSIGQGEGK